MQDELTKLVRHAAVYGVGRVLGRAASFLLIPVYTHYFSRADYGGMEILNLVAMVAGIVLALGLPTTVMRFYYASDDAEERSETVSTAMLFSVSLGGTVAALVFLYAGPISRLLLGTSEQPTLVRLVAITFFFSYSSDIALVYLRAKQRSSLYVFLTQGAFFAAMALNLYLVAAKKMGVAGAFWGNAIATGTVGIILLALMQREVSIRFSPKKLIGMLRFGTPLIFIWVAAFVLNYSDRFFLQRYTDLATVGLYALAYKFGYVLSLIVVQPFQLMWEPQSYEVAKREDAQEVFSRIFVLYTIALIAIAFSMSLLIREVFDVLVDAKFYSGYRMVPLIAFAYVIQGAGLFFEAGLLIQKKSHAIAGIGIFSTFLCIVLNSVLIFFWNAWGACAATLLSFVALSTATYFLSQRHYPLQCDFKGVAKVASLSLGLLAVGWWLPIGPLAFRVVAKLTLLVIFFLGILRLKVLRAEETESLKSLALTGLQKLGWMRMKAAFREG